MLSLTGSAKSIRPGRVTSGEPTTLVETSRHGAEFVLYRPISMAERGDRAMRIGVPKEIKIQEYRGGVTPGAARELVQHGHGVVIEHEAGVGIGYHDDAYRAAGATIANSAAQIFDA